jgi:hypothetical protein
MDARSNIFDRPAMAILETRISIGAELEEAPGD